MGNGRLFAGVAVAALFLALPAGASAGICETQTNAADADITEATPATTLVNTIGKGGDLTDVDVHLDIVHPNPEQLAVYVEHVTVPPSLQQEVSGGNGAGGENYTGTIFDDEALNPIIGAPAPFTGRWRPESPLSYFDGQNDGGAWKIYVYDQDDPDHPDDGYLDSWGVTTSSTACDGPEPPPPGGGGTDPGSTTPTTTPPPKKCKKGQKLKRGKCVKKKKKKK